MYSGKWNPETREGKKRLEHLLVIVKRLTYREDLKAELKKESMFAGFSTNVVLNKLNREQMTNPTSALSRAWAAIPLKPHVAIRLFPDEKRREALKQALTDPAKTLDDIERDFPEYKLLLKNQRDSINRFFGITRPHSGWTSRLGKKTPTPVSAKEEPTHSKNWWIRLTEEQKQEFLADYRKDYRLTGNTNDDYCEKWTRITGEQVSAESLSKAARYFGETRNRVQIVAEYKTIAQVLKAMDDRITQLILAGTLAEAGLDVLFETIKQEFREDLEKVQFNLTQEYFTKRTDKLVWTEGKAGALTELNDFIDKGFTAEKFHEYHRHIPLEMIKAKILQLTGTTNIENPPPFVATAFARGIGRLIGDIPEAETEPFQRAMKEFKIPEISFDQPLDIPFRDIKNFRTGVINGPNLGILHAPRIENNTFRQALAFAKLRGWEHLFLHGIFDLDMTKAEGPVKGIRALYSGRNTNIDVLDPGYQEEARRIIRAIEANEFTNEILYETAKEALMNLLRGLWKVMLHNKKPVFPGRISVILGPKEFDAITAAAHAEILYATLCKQEELKLERGAAANAVRRHQKQLSKLEGRIWDYEFELSQGPNPQDEEALRAKIEAVRQKIDETKQKIASHKQKVRELKKMEARTRMTNVRPEEWQRFHKIALTLVSILIERAIPNSKVISLGSTYIKVGPEPKDKIKFVIPGNLKITDASVSNYANTYSTEALSMKMAETIIICPPYSVGYAMTAREVDSKGTRGYASRIYNALTCIDGPFIREKTKNVIRESHPIGQLANHPMFQGGILEINCVDGMVTANPVTTETLASCERRAKGLIHGKNALADKYIWVMIATDQHYGGRAKEFLEDRETGKSLGMAEAVFHLMRKAGYGDGDKLPPFHIFTVNDDPTQGHHFPAEKEPHRHEMQYHRYEKELNKLRAQYRTEKNPRIKEALMEKIAAFSKRQVRVRGTDSYTRQMQDFIHRHIKGNIDMFSGMLKRSEKAGLILKPVSEFEDYLEIAFDTCDLGFINLGTGNHGLSTTEDNLSEGVIFAEIMKPYLMMRPHWHDKPELLDRYVTGPTFGNKFIAFGTVKAPGGYEYGFDLRNSPATNTVDWGNTVRAGARTDLRRANYGARIFEEKLTVIITGDKHFLSALLMALRLHLMSPAGTHTDAYGERGFPPNGSGIALLGLPAEGPASGPILIRYLLLHHLRDYIEKNPRQLDFEALLVNPL